MAEGAPGLAGGAMWMSMWMSWHRGAQPDFFPTEQMVGWSSAMDGAAAWCMVRSATHAGCVSEGSVWMSSSSDWEMPQAVQPKPENYAFDLEQALSALVGLRAIIPADAFTA
jgi:hypothetical protein